VFFFLSYISILTFALTKLLTGIFVQQAKEANEHDKARTIASNLHALFKDIDEDESGYITKEEFAAHMLDKRVLAYFALLQMTAHDVDKVSALIDQGQDNRVDISEFIDGCQRFKGHAKSVDMAMVNQQIRELTKQSTIFMHYVEERFDMLKQLHRGQEAPTPVSDRLKLVKPRKGKEEMPWKVTRS